MERGTVYYLIAFVVGPVVLFTSSVPMGLVIIGVFFALGVFFTARGAS
jgi:hypothetical protein